MLNIPLMRNNVNQSDIDTLIDFLKKTDRFTQGPRVKEFETAWSKWLGVKHSLFVNSGSSANFMTLAGIRELYGVGEVITSPIGWSSDISSIMMAGMQPVFADVNLDTLGMNESELLNKITSKTKAVLLPHILGFNALSIKLVKELEKRNIPLIEDVCESHGAKMKEEKLGSIGYASNFSFYYAHHMTTIEGGMICTNNDEFYQIMRMYRSHGMLRESDDENFKRIQIERYSDLHPEFLFMVPGYNMRNTELNAVIGLNQLKRLDENICKRQRNLDIFLSNLKQKKIFKDFMVEGSSNYAFVILLSENDPEFYEKLVNRLKEENVEFRRGTAGGGNLIRQPFVRNRYPELKPEDYQNAELIHSFGVYTGNYPELEKEKILGLCSLLNRL